MTEGSPAHLHTTPTLQGWIELDPQGAPCHCPFYPSDTQAPVRNFQSQGQADPSLPFSFSAGSLQPPEEKWPRSTTWPTRPQKIRLTSCHSQLSIPHTPVTGLLANALACHCLPELSASPQGSPGQESPVCSSVGFTRFHPIGPGHLSPSSISNLGAASLRGFCVSFTH